MNKFKYAYQNYNCFLKRKGAVRSFIISTARKRKQKKMVIRLLRKNRKNRNQNDFRPYRNGFTIKKFTNL